MSDISLEQLRNQIINSLSGISSEISDSDDISYEAFLVLARTTGQPVFLQNAFNRIETLEDPSSKASALIELLDEVEMQLASSQSDSAEQSSQVQGQQS